MNKRKKNCKLTTTSVLKYRMKYSKNIKKKKNYMYLIQRILDNQ